MISDVAIEARLPPSRPLRLRFSLLTLLVVLTLICLLFAWWQFVYLERQRLFARRDAIALAIDRLNHEMQDDWEVYMDIARETGRDSGAGNVLLNVDLKRLGRIDDELMQLESRAVSTESGQAAQRTSLEKRIAGLRQQQKELEKQIETRTERSVELETRERELEQKQQIANKLSMQLQEIEIEITTRGIKHRPK
jgi:myosin heavy subunit